MRCSDFLDQHCAFIDDTLAGVELVRMQRHIAECGACAEHDTRVRRSLMVVRSLRPIEPSPDFTRRLEARIRECRDERTEVPCHFRTVAVVGAVASMLMLAYLAESLPATHGGRSMPRDIVLPPVVAMAEPPQPEIVASQGADDTPASAIIASLSAGMPIWPVAVFAEQASLHLASYSRPD